MTLSDASRSDLVRELARRDGVIATVEGYGSPCRERLYTVLRVPGIVEMTVKEAVR